MSNHFKVFSIHAEPFQYLSGLTTHVEPLKYLSLPTAPEGLTDGEIDGLTEGEIELETDWLIEGLIEDEGL